MEYSTPTLLESSRCTQRVPSVPRHRHRRLSLLIAIQALALMCALPLLLAAAFAVPAGARQNLASGERAALRSSSAPGTLTALAAGATASAASQGGLAEQPVARRAGSWLPSLPQTCEDDYECNDGKANFPLQCCELPVMGKFCCEPDDFQPVPSTPAFVPLPVPSQEPW
eukprot:CAMPEP_0171096822 /NCGR_PEP_ID=MMETSP0766_2-20121228/46031_1 /TAXON_ID=439317 /ORGANISM="Gambierdiscus australes, Strain CAWD 149" /LENGTH=169 /DNA_ID=CAMNT_0011555893 /DNA_START=51 /DNA_END=560 /DNA_ORIENTATION=+